MSAVFEHASAHAYTSFRMIPGRDLCYRAKIKLRIIGLRVVTFTVNTGEKAPNETVI